MSDLADLLAALADRDLPVTLAYHPDANYGDGYGWSLELGDLHRYGTLAEIVDVMRKEVDRG